MHQPHSYTVVGSRSTTLPVSLAELKAHLNITTSTEDTRLTALEWAAVDWIERQLGRFLVSTTLTEVYAHFPSLWRNGHYWSPFYPYPLLETPTGLPWQWSEMQRITLARSPVSSLTSLHYYDTSNVLQTLTSGTDFYLITPTDKPAFLQPVNVWPIPYYRPDAIQIAYTAGYSTVPGSLNAAIKLLVGAWNEFREDTTALSAKQIPIGVLALLNSVETGRYV